MIRHIRNASFLVLMIVLVLARTVNASSGCSTMNCGILGCTGTCDSCYEGAMASEDNCNSWGSAQGKSGVSENFSCYETLEGADFFCSCYYPPE